MFFVIRLDMYKFNPSVNNLQVPVIYFPKRQKGLRRKKRDWVIPEINVSENERKQYPHRVSQVRDALSSLMKHRLT